MKTLLTTLILSTSVVLSVFGEEKKCEHWFEKSCGDVYHAIAIFPSLAEKQWKTYEDNIWQKFEVIN